MAKLLHWHKATTGLHVGMAKFAFLNFYNPPPLSDKSFQQTLKAHTRLMVALRTLENFSTRDYAYDRGGQSISGKEMEMFMVVVWK